MSESHREHIVRVYPTDEKMADEHKDINQVRSIIEKSLTMTQSSFVAYLVNLPHLEKSRLISALIQNNQDEIKRFLFEPLLQVYPALQQKPETLRGATELSSVEIENSTLLNTTVLKLIEVLLMKQDVKNKAYIIKKAMQFIPDTLLSIKEKCKLARVIHVDAAEEIGHEIDDYSFTSPPAALSMNKYEGNISLQEYYRICSNNELDISEFIILTLGVLQKSTDGMPNATNDLNEIRALYNNLEYDKALLKLHQFCDQYVVLLDKPLVNMIKKKIDEPFQLKKPKVYENFVRRFYENRLIQLAADHIYLEKINKVSRGICGVSAASIEEIPDILSAATAKKTNKIIQRFLQLISNVRRFHERDRVAKGIFPIHLQDLENKSNETVLSQNPGLMVSNQPNFMDETTPHSLTNKVVDIFTDAELVTL